MAETRVLIVDRNAGFPALLRSMQPSLVVTSVQSGVGASGALGGSGAQVAVVELEAPSSEVALALLQREAVPVLLVSEDHGPESPQVLRLMERFGVLRFVQRPFPLLDFGDLLVDLAGQAASLQPVEPESSGERLVAPWDLDPEAWAEEPSEVHKAPPRPPWEENPDAWQEEPARRSAPAPRPSFPAPRPSAPPPSSTRAAPEPAPQRAATPPAGDRPASLVPPWERKPDRWSALEKPVAPWDVNPSEWNQPQRVAHTDLERVNVKVLRRMMALWLRHRNGVLTADEVRGNAAFADGAPVDKASEAVIRDILQLSDARMQFADGPRQPNRSRQAFGALLFGAAQDLTKEGWVEANASLALQVVSHLTEVEELPIGVHTLKVLQTADGVLKLLDHLSALRVRLDDVEGHLAALSKLKLIELVDTRVDLDRRRTRKNWVVSSLYEGPDRRSDERRSGPERRRNRDRRRDRRRAGAIQATGDDRREEDRRQGDRRSGEERRRQDSQEVTRKTLKARKRRKPVLGADAPTVPADVEKLLDREWALIKDADAWTVLGLPSTETREVVLATGQRMLGRYEDVEGDDSRHPGTREKARKVCERIRWAMRTARPSVAQGTGRVTRDETIFSEGVRALLVKDYTTALNCFRTAHKMAVEEPRYMGYYGWALWKRAESETGADQAKTRKKAEGLLRLSDTMDNGNGPCQLFLARVELESGDLNRAKARVERLRERGDDTPGVDLIWIEIQKQEARAAKESGPERT